MAGETKRIVLFGDQAYDFIPRIRELLSLTDHPILAAFLDQAHFVVRAQMMQSLPASEHKISRTSNLSHMIQKYVDGKLNPAFRTALSTICQLACFIQEFEDFGKPYPCQDDSYVFGVCTGSLAAAAVSCSSSLSELLPLAVQTVLISFRLGLRAVEQRDNLELSVGDRSKPWSVVCWNVEEQAATTAIANFNREKTLAKPKQPRITAIASNALTISGSPRTLTALLALPPFAQSTSKEIPIHVPSHNPDLFSQYDVEWILQNTSDRDWASHSVKIPFLSSVSGKPSWVTNYRGLIETALSHCLLEPIRLDKVESEVPEFLASQDVAHVTLMPFVCNTTYKCLSRSLTARGIANEVCVSSGTSEKFSHRPGHLKSKLAIISASGRFPEAQNTSEFWNILYKGVDTCKEVPLRRWDVNTHVDPSGKAHNKGGTRWGCWLDFYAQFDPRFFNISPKEAPQMDPAQRMALMSTYEAMERGGVVPDTTPSTQRNRIGVFHGVTSNDWMETNTAQNIDTYFITGGNRGFIPGRINFCFEFSGPSYSNDTACSSSLAAIHLACNSLWRGDCDTAVAGGTNMIFTPDGHTGLDKGFFLSRTGNCKPFDDNADGYCRAEGVGSIFIKRLEDALADNDPILGLILDVKTNHSSMSDSMTRPHAGAQIENMSAVLSDAGVTANDLSYLEMHGTGTQVGDAVEMESVLAVFAPEENSRPKDRPLHIGSAKANVGHGEGVSGVTSLVKVLLMMQNNTIPPHCGIKPGSKINRNYPDLGARNVHISFNPTSWPRTTQPRRVLINNFSAAGGNTAMLIEDAPQRPLADKLKPDPRTSHLVIISGHVGKSLKTNLERLLRHLRETKDVSLPQLSYTTTARRWHHLHRVSVSGSTIEQIHDKLDNAIKSGEGINRPKTKSTVIFAFTGQGSQYFGMGRQLYETYPKFREDLQSYDQIARTHGFPGFLHVYTTSGGNIDDCLPVILHLATTCLEMALANVLKLFGFNPKAVVGHSLGEYAALYTAGVLSASDTIYIVGKRAELLQDRCQRGTHAMLALRASADSCMAALPSETKCEVACINGPHDTILSGPVSGTTEAQRNLAKDGVKGTILNLPFAFHSAQVQPILEDLREIASSVGFEKPSLAVLSPLLGKVIQEDGVFGPEYLTRHCREPVDIVSALRSAQENGTIDDRTIVVEVGPKPLLCGMIRMTLGTNMTALPTLSQTSDVWANLQTILATSYTRGLDFNWAAYHSPFDAAKRVIDLPDYGWDLADYFIPYQGDWCLHRHKIECNCADKGQEVPTSKYPMPLEATSPRKPAKLDSKQEAYPEIKKTTTIHRVVEEQTEPLGATLIVETDISRKDVNDIAKGHVVDDIPLLTPSFYADIALQVGKYSMDRLRAGHANAIDGLVDVSDLVVDKALIPHGQGPQLLRTTVTMQWPPKAAATTRSAKVKFATYFADGKLDTEHATCTVRFTSHTQLKSLQKRASEYKEQIHRLREGVRKGDFVRYNRKSGYKLMRGMANFHADYKLLDKLVLNESENEATSLLDFSDCQSDGDFYAHPAYVDAITQVAGFAMNANDRVDIDKEAFVNHGWESLQIYQSLVKGKEYQVHTKLNTCEDGAFVKGDIIVLDGDDVVAFFKGLSLRRVPRKALRAVLKSALERGSRKQGGKLSQASKPEERSRVPSETFAAHKPSVPPISAAPKQQAPLPTRTAELSHDTVNAVLRVISDESGLALEDLTDDSNFIEIGVDSLSSMVISSRLREDFGMDLAADFSLFVDCPTVKALKEYLEPKTRTFTGDPAVHPEPRTPEPMPALAVATDSQPPVSQVNMGSTVKFAIEIIASEIGVAVEDLTPETVFADIGVDSLSSMVISSRFREELDIGLDSSFSLFEHVPTIADLGKFLGSDSDKASSAPSTEIDRTHSPDASSPSRTSSEEPDRGTDPDEYSRSDPDHSDRKMECRPCVSVILQGLPRVARKSLFMLPDGGGSAWSYVPIPQLQADVAIIGLNCPYARDPENMARVHYKAMMRAFCDEIRRRQPSGPYDLGGWSSGGAFAYCVAEALLASGSEVRSLIIIDAPVPQPMEQLPTSFYERCNAGGLFANQPGGGQSSAVHQGQQQQPPSYLIPHFQAVVDIMLDYRPAPLKTDHMPKVGLVWATETAVDEAEAPKMKGMHFMLNRRTEFGPDGWDGLLPGASFDIVKATGANHFTLMSKDHVHLISGLIDRVMA